MAATGRASNPGDFRCQYFNQFVVSSNCFNNGICTLCAHHLPDSGSGKPSSVIYGGGRSTGNSRTGKKVFRQLSKRYL